MAPHRRQYSVVCARDLLDLHPRTTGLMSIVESSDDDDEEEFPVAKRPRLTKRVPDESQCGGAAAMTGREFSPAEPRSRPNALTKNPTLAMDSHAIAGKDKGKARASSSGARPQPGGLARLAAASSGAGVVNEGGSHAGEESYGG